MAAIISLHSFRGGTGKSNLTANLAATFALQGRRVGIVDADIQSPGIHVLFGLDEQQVDHALNDYLHGACPIEQTAHDVTPPGVAQRGGSIQLIPSSIKTGEIARVLREGYDVALLHDGFTQLIRALKLDILLIDTHPGLNEETLLSIAISDLLLVVLRPDRQDFQGTAVIVEVARQLDVPRMYLVMNKVLASMDGAALREQAERTYNAPVAGLFPLSEEIFELGSAGIFCLLHPDRPWSEHLRQLAARVEA